MSRQAAQKATLRTVAKGTKMPLLIVIYNHEKTEAEIHGDHQNAELCTTKKD